MSVSLPINEGTTVVEQAAATTTPEDGNMLARLRRSRLAQRCSAVALGAAITVGALAAPAKAAYEDISGMNRWAHEMAGQNPKESKNNLALPSAIDAVNDANKGVGLPVFALDGLNNGEAIVAVNRCLNPIMLKHAGITSPKRRVVFENIIEDQTSLLVTSLPTVKLVANCDPTAIHPEETSKLAAFGGKKHS